MAFLTDLPIATPGKAHVYTLLYADKDGTKRTHSTAAFNLPRTLDIKHTPFGKAGTRHLVSLERHVRIASGASKPCLINLTITNPDDPEFTPELIGEELAIMLNFFHEKLGVMDPYQVDPETLLRLLRGES